MQPGRDVVQGRKVRDYMTTETVSVTRETGIHEAIRLLVSRGISGMPVVDPAGAVVGVLSERDCFRVAFDTGYYQERGGQVADYMTAPAETVDADDDTATVAHAFLRGPFRRFPVTSEGRLVGVLSRRDTLRAIEDLS